MTAIINGSSPSVTFSDGTTQATSAIVSGYVPYANLPAGSVLQVVNATYTTSFSTTSSSAVSTGATATITPKYATSKILVLCSPASGSQSASATGAGSVTFSIYRGGSQVGNAASCGGREGPSSWQMSYYFNVSLSVLDAPATTSAVTYTLYVGNFTGGTSVSSYLNQQGNGTGTTFTLMEIAA